MVLQRFYKWQVAPGNPLDRSIQLKVMEPNDVNHLGREFMVKTRRRKGLVEDLNLTKYFENEETKGLALEDEELKPYFD